MRLKSRGDNHQVFLDTPAILMDTCALTWFTQQENFKELLNEVAGAYMVLVPTPVLYELAFGARDQADPKELWLRDLLLDPKRHADLHMIGLAKQSKSMPKSNIFFINPNWMEWYSARERLIRLSTFEDAAGAGKLKRMHTLDSLIYSCARNCFVPICTRDEDFKLLNRSAAAVHYEGTVPVFTPEELVRSLTEDVWYEGP